MVELGKKKCQICVGCGRCVEAVSGLHVITESFLKPELLPTGKTVGKGSFCIVDVGTTTIAMELYGESGEKIQEYVQSNPQRFFGADVISRIQAAENPMYARQMRRQVMEVLEQGIKKFREEVCAPTQIYIAGNTTMLNLLCGYDVQPLGYAPFRAEHLESERFAIEGIEAVTLPGLSAFVGADIVAGMLACGIHRSKGVSLLVDLGTNGEMVLGNAEKMVACSTAAGPAFEGMLQAQGKAVWGADMVKYTAALLKAGILDETGLLQEPYFAEGVTIGGICITQENIRNLQTAKAAVAAGIQALTAEYGLRDIREIDKVYLAGGFGYYLEEESALHIGLLPQELDGKIQTIGNSALAGGYYYHICEAITEELMIIQRNTKVVNLAEMKAFTLNFVKNMNLKTYN